MNCWLSLPVHCILCGFYEKRFNFDALPTLSTGHHRLGINIGNLMVIVYCMCCCSRIQISISEICFMFFNSCFEISSSLAYVQYCEILLNFECEFCVCRVRLACEFCVCHVSFKIHSQHILFCNKGKNTNHCHKNAFVISRKKLHFSLQVSISRIYFAQHFFVSLKL